jgi:hypothetical protein
MVAASVTHSSPSPDSQATPEAARAPATIGIAAQWRAQRVDAVMPARSSFFNGASSAFIIEDLNIRTKKLDQVFSRRRTSGVVSGCSGRCTEMEPTLRRVLPMEESPANSGIDVVGRGGLQLAGWLVQRFAGGKLRKPFS